MQHPPITQNNMGFDILLWGVLLLAIPIFGITDIVAAVLIIVALYRGKVYLADFKRAIPFSWILLVTGLLELLFGLIIPFSDIATTVLYIWRCGLIIPLLTYIISGIKELAIVGENKEIHDMSERLKKPIFISACLCAVLVTLGTFFSWINPFEIAAKIFLAVIIIMLLQVIFRCYKELNVYPGAVSDDEENI